LKDTNSLPTERFLYLRGKKSLFSLAFLLLQGAPACAEVETFYLGTYTSTSPSQGIYLDTLDTESGKLGPIQLATKAKVDPTYLALSPNGRFLFAAMSNAVASFKILSNGALQAINRQPSGANTCHVSLNPNGSQLFSASYDEGSIAAYPVSADGRIGPRTASISLKGSGPDRERQEGSHAHSVYVDPENHFLYACDLGSDRIWIFRLGDQGRLLPASPPAVAVSPGCGPRHLAFSPDGRLLYVVNELGVSTSVFSRDPSTGALAFMETNANIDPGWPAGTGSAEVCGHPSGKWLYVSTRLEDMISVFRINTDLLALKTGKRLFREEIVPSPVAFPRSFAIDATGQWLIVAGQTDNRVSAMKINPVTGHLIATGQHVNVGCPVCVLFAKIN
jgi:6-phosphogluconolactonase